MRIHFRHRLFYRLKAVAKSSMARGPYYTVHLSRFSWWKIPQKGQRLGHVRLGHVGPLGGNSVQPKRRRCEREHFVNKKQVPVKTSKVCFFVLRHQRSVCLIHGWGQGRQSRSHRRWWQNGPIRFFGFKAFLICWVFFLHLYFLRNALDL